MSYNFDIEYNRRGTNSYKWDVPEAANSLPMWVADMDFQTAPCIVEALKQRVEHGIFGYTYVPDGYYESIINWFSRRHGWLIDKEWIQYTTGVVPAISAVIKALTVPGDSVLIQSPVYNCFYSSIRNNGCNIVESPLLYQNNSYEIDFEDLERCLSDPKVKVLLFCNPHNPAGRVWTREELLRVSTLCIRNHVWIVSDEIHCELVMPNHQFVPIASLSDEILKHTITCNSPSKSFNTAGLQIANIICSDKSVQAKIDRAININEVCDVNPFGVIALQAAYDKGEDWINELNNYIYHNYILVEDFFKLNLPQFHIVKLEGTYLVWIDCKCLKKSSQEICDYLVKSEKLMLNPGTMYGNSGEGFIRLNIACPKTRLSDALGRLARGLTNLLQMNK